LLQGTAVRIQNATELGLITTATIEREEEEEETVTQHYYYNNEYFLRAYYSFRGLLLHTEREREREREKQYFQNLQFRKKGDKNRHARVFFFSKFLN
jgi:hypothetical protein